MTSRGTKYWASGAIPLIGPDILGDIIATLADIAIVISSQGQVLSVLANPIHRSYADLTKWERRDVREFLTVESVPKFDRALATYLDTAQTSRPIELNHIDTTADWEFPINYTLHRIGPDGAILMLGRDLRPIAEMQQQLVKAQMALERDYESQREYDTRFQVLLGQTQDAVAFVSVGTGRITEMNLAAARLLGKSREALMGRALAAELAGPDAARAIDRLTVAAQGEGHGSVPLDVAQSGRRVVAHPTLFRAAGERLLLCRLAAADTPDTPGDDYTRNLVALYEAGSDAIAMTDRNGTITATNEAFLNLVDGTDAGAVKGRMLGDFLSRGPVDQRVLLENAARAGKMRLYSTRIVGEYGGQRPVSISATWLADGTAPCVAFVMRDAAVGEAVRMPAAATAPTAGPRPVMDLVGSSTLKDIVAQTTDVVEKMCIETAIELTGNNRVAAAEMLGLSRQSLYVKLRKFGLLSKDGPS